MTRSRSRRPRLPALLGLPATVLALVAASSGLTASAVTASPTSTPSAVPTTGAASTAPKTSAAGAASTTDATGAITRRAPTAGEATGPDRQSAEQLFGRYIDLEHAFDPALVDLYSDQAHVQSRIIVAGRPPTVRDWSGVQYKELLRRALAKAKEQGKDLNYYSAVTYLREGSRVRIKAMRYADLQKAVSPVELLVGPDAAGKWRIFEELSESHPLLQPPPPKP